MSAKTKPDKPKPSLFKLAALQIVSGGSAGFVEVCIMHPLDLVKTRLQIQNKKTVGSTGYAGGASKHVMFSFSCSYFSELRKVFRLNANLIFQIYYNGVLDCFRKMYEFEGLYSYWKGILPPILAETPKRATKFVRSIFCVFESQKHHYLIH